MRMVTANEVDQALSYPALVDVLAAAFNAGAVSPLRHHHTMKLPAGEPDATLLLMPAWTTSAPGAETAGKYLGVKAVSVFPGNRNRGEPAVQGAYMLLSATDGKPLAVIDAPRLTAWRTAAASALASRYLSRTSSRRLALLGAGALGFNMVQAHASVRPIREVVIWNRTRAGAEQLAARIAAAGFGVEVADTAQAAVRGADIVTTATLATEPVLHGAWLEPGMHLDCVGAYRPHMRETDDAVVRRARIWVDTRAGCTVEAGDIVIPLSTGTITPDRIEGDLYGLVRGTAPVRTGDEEITLFKSVGAAIEDLAAAVAVFEHTIARDAS